MSAQGPIVVGLNAAIVCVTDESPRALVVTADGLDALPFGPFDPEHDRTLERGLRRWVTEQARLELGYVEQLYTFGDRFRDPSETKGGPRRVSVGYLALVREAVSLDITAAWHDWYLYVPWEDWRRGKPAVLDREIVPALTRWAGEETARRERIDLNFGERGSPWNDERVLERYELMYEAGLVEEARRDGREGALPSGGFGQAMALDHRRMLATAIGRVRGKLKYRPVVFELLPPTFTLLQFQRTVEALAGKEFHKANFRRLVEGAGLVERTGTVERELRGRPAELFRFRREVVRERPAPGLRLGR